MEDDSTTRSSGASPADTVRTRGKPSSPRLAEDPALGKTTIASSVVQKIAGIAAREVTGVFALGGGLSRVLGGIRQHMPGSAGVSHTTGVSVEVGEKQAAVNLDLIVEYGVPIVDLAKAVRRNVIGTIEEMTGLEVVEVNIAVNDIHLVAEADGEAATTAPIRVE